MQDLNNYTTEFLRVSDRSDLAESYGNRRILLGYLEACCLTAEPAEELARDCPIGRLTVARFKNNPQSVKQMGEWLSRHQWLTLSGPERVSSPEGAWHVAREILQVLEARLGADYFGADPGYHNPLPALRFAGSSALASNLLELKIENSRLLAQTSRGLFSIDLKRIEAWNHRKESLTAVSRHLLSIGEGLWNHHWSWPTDRQIPLEELLRVLPEAPG